MSFAPVILSTAAGRGESSLGECCLFVSRQCVLQPCHSKPMAGHPGCAPLRTPHLLPPDSEKGWAAEVFGAFPLVKLEAEVVQEHLWCN